MPFTRAGCDVADIATANQELENTTPDIAQAFGANSPEAQQLAADTDSFKDAETADYVGVAVHCAQGNAFCAGARADRGNQTTPSPTAVTDSLPDEPGGYSGFQALFGHRYVAPQLGAGTPGLTHHGYQVTNAAGNLVDENGNQINGAFLTNHPGFPGFGPINASQTLADSGTTGTWMDETDLRPTLMYLTGLKDDYEHDGRVVTQILSDPNSALSSPAVASLGACYKQLNSSVGQFGNFTLQASTAAVESSTAGDGEYKAVDAALTGLNRLRDTLALRVKGELEAAAFGDQPVFGASGQTAACQGIIAAAGALAHHL